MFLFFRFSKYNDSCLFFCISDLQSKFILVCFCFSDFLQMSIKQIPPSDRKVHVLLVIFITQEIQDLSESLSASLGNEKENDGDGLISISEDTVDALIGHLEDLQESVKTFTINSEDEDVQVLARQCCKICLELVSIFSQPCTQEFIYVLMFIAF